MNKECYIIGGGMSLEGFDFSTLRDVDTIAVNKSVFFVPDPTYFITTDYSFLNKMKNQNLYSKFTKLSVSKIFVVQSFLPYIVEDKGRIADTRFKLVYNLKDFDMIIKSNKDRGMGFSFSDFRSGVNSGFCALQLAVLLGYEKIYLLGIDLQAEKQTHYHGGYAQNIRRFRKNLHLYYKYFVKGIHELKRKKPEIKVISRSPNSKLNRIIPYEL